jgi:D-arabinose 1-dehydrogenase-like Zn-dependent alcohol dehydrogenase
MIGGMKETQDCIDFCAKHNIIPTTQVTYTVWYFSWKFRNLFMKARTYSALFQNF